MTSPTPDDDALLALAFSLQANPGAYAVLLGAGVSAPSGILTAWGVVSDLISRLAALIGEEEPADHEQWYIAGFGQPPRYQAILEKLAPASVERQRLLKRYFEPADPESGSEDKKPTIAHRSLARLVKAGTIRVLITLNFDRLLEQAIRAEGIEPTIVTSAADAEGLAPLHTLDCCVVHLHGDYLNPGTMLNTDTELDAYEPGMLGLLQRILRDYGLILAGWSGLHDPALIEAIKTQYPGRYTLTWIEPALQSDLATEFRILMKGTLVSADADMAFGFLADSVASLIRRRARHPLTAAVAAETAKRELSGRWVAIGLHDRLAVEFEALHRLPEFPTTDNQPEASDGYEAMLERIDEASKVPVALVSALGYWGDEKTDLWWIDEIERFSRTLRASGQTRLLNLRLVTGSALYYSAGIAAIASKRYDLLGKLLRHQRSNPFNDRQEQLADVLAADHVLDGTPPRLYKFLRPVLAESLVAGTERLEDAWQLFEVLRMASVAMNDQRYSELAGQLAAQESVLLHAEERAAEAEQNGGHVEHWKHRVAEALQARDKLLGLLANLVNIRRPHVLATDHVIHSRWAAPTADRIVAELEGEKNAHPLIRAGLAANSSTLATAVRAVNYAIGRIANDLSWEKTSGGGIPDELWIDTGLTPQQLAQQENPTA